MARSPKASIALRPLYKPEREDQSRQGLLQLQLHMGRFTIAAIALPLLLTTTLYVHNKVTRVDYIECVTRRKYLEVASNFWPTLGPLSVFFSIWANVVDFVGRDEHGEGHLVPDHPGPKLTNHEVSPLIFPQCAIHHVSSVVCCNNLIIQHTGVTHYCKMYTLFKQKATFVSIPHLLVFWIFPPWTIPDPCQLCCLLHT